MLKNNKSNQDYRDIIDLPHFHASGRDFMSNHQRAAQFMPFKSLKGYDEMVEAEERDIMDEEWQYIIFEE